MSLRRTSSATWTGRATRLGAALGLAITAAGCSLLRGPAAEPTRFYVLDAMPENRLEGRPLSIGLGPVSLPPYLERSQMVDRIGENQLAYDEFNYWSEPLKENFNRVMATNLDRLLRVERLVLYPWYRSTILDNSISITVLRFEPQPDRTVLLHARWAIADDKGQVVLNRESSLRHPGGSPAECAAAMSALAGELAADIAAALREIKP